MIVIENRRKGLDCLTKLYRDSVVIDVTSRSTHPLYVTLSPFYPHGNIPVPYTKDTYAESVEGIWQGLKVFEHQGIDTSYFHNRTMRNIKRTSRKYGKVLGHSKGIHPDAEILDYESARRNIYIPTYGYVLTHAAKAKEAIASLREYIDKGIDLVLLDYNTCTDINDLKTPLSHANLIKIYLERDGCIV